MRQKMFLCLVLVMALMVFSAGTAVEAATYNITASAGINGSILPSGTILVNGGDSQTFTITANAGNRILDVSVDGVSQGPITSYTFSNVTSDHTISASFDVAIVGYITPEKAYDNVQRGIGIIIDIRSVEEHNTKDAAWDPVPGATQSDPSNRGVATWIDPNGARRVAPLAPWWTAAVPAAVDGPDPDTTASILENSDDFANFITSIEGLLGADVIEFDTPIYYICKIGGRTYGASWWTSTHVFTNPATGETGKFSALYSVDADTDPKGLAGGMIEWISIGLPRLIGDTPPNAYINSITYGVGGDAESVDVLIKEPRDSGYYTYPPVESINLYADGMPADSLSDLDLTPGGTINNYFTMSTAAIAPGAYKWTIAVKDDGTGGRSHDPYAINPTIKATSTANGTTIPSGDVNVTEGDNQAFTILPDNGYQVTDVLVDGVTVGAVATYTFQNVTADHTIYALFEASALAPDISVNPAGQDFGTVVIGETSPVSVFTISNNGTADLLVSNATLTGTNPFQFAIDSDTCSGATLQPATDCTVGVVFSPTVAQGMSASLLISSDDPDTPDLDIGLSGTGVEFGAVPDISASPVSHDFGAVTVGETSPVAVFTVTNNGIADLAISDASLTGTNPFQFTIKSNTCSGAIVPPATYCIIDVVFNPTSAGDMSASVAITSNDPDTPDLSIGLSGTSIEPVGTPDISISPASHDFGGVNIGETSPVAIFTITNNGTANLVISDAYLTGSNLYQFAIKGDSCSGVTIQPADNCIIDVAFSPTRTGDMSASLIVTSNDPVTPDLYAGLSGTGVDPNALPEISLSPATQDFGSLDVGDISPAAIFTVTNNGTGDLVIYEAYLAGTNPYEFVVENDTCSGATVAPAESCTIDLVFSPTVAGDMTALLVVESNDPDMPDISADLSGTALDTSEDDGKGKDSNSKKKGKDKK